MIPSLFLPAIDYFADLSWILDNLYNITMVSMEMDHDVTKVDIHFWILKNQRAIEGGIEEFLSWYIEEGEI